jgi:hypothetical protein
MQPQKTPAPNGPTRSEPEAVWARSQLDGLRARRRREAQVPETLGAPVPEPDGAAALKGEAAAAGQGAR